MLLGHAATLADARARRYMVTKMNLERKKKRLAEKKRLRNLHNLKRMPRIFLMRPRCLLGGGGAAIGLHAALGALHAKGAAGGVAAE